MRKGKVAGNSYEAPGVRIGYEERLWGMNGSRAGYEERQRRGASRGLACSQTGRLAGSVSCERDAACPISTG
jgi:hypothetical protein